MMSGCGGNDENTGLLGRANIEFLRPIGLEETQELIDYVCRNLPERVNYHASYHMSAGQSFQDKNEFFSQRGTVYLVGMISRGDGSAFDGFNCIISREQEDTSRFGRFSFQTIPGNDESDHDPQALVLWDDVRRLIGQYFERVPSEIKK
jgi:hypothetical protein